MPIVNVQQGQNICYFDLYVAHTHSQKQTLAQFSMRFLSKNSTSDTFAVEKFLDIFFNYAF